ncbi:MAG: 3-hydroxyacyl-CoA dehydrogenase NAD-binding domain-containing protein [Dehalococcoidia bacterium]|nr:3-hydroxyacyl-CoA dehydrogenase NAD-binding domain-containing protein [Dehalococcoidia bacterium]
MPNGGIQPVGDAAVVGVEDEGQWIALALALGSFRVVIVDSSRENLDRALDDVRNELGSLEQQGMVDRRAAERAQQHLVPSTSIAGAMGEVGFAVEAMADDLELKRGVLAELDLHCPDRTVLASTGSSFSVSHLAISTSRPDRVVVTRWGSPAHLERRVEIVPGPTTSERTIDWTRGVLEYIGKEPVAVTACTEPAN